MSGAEKVSGKIKVKLSGKDFIINENSSDAVKLNFAKNLYEEHAKVILGEWPSAQNLDYLTVALNSDNQPFKIGKGSTHAPQTIVCAFPKNLSSNFAVSFHQKIIFGPPGTGKSYSVDEIASSLGIEGCPDRRVQTVFHPEYTYGDFIAKLMPISKGSKVEYRVVAGHFIKALAKALTDDTNVLLQIDEINRGNCAAIFGDIFQLLDRDVNGQSSYSIQLSELALRALAQEIVGKETDGSYDEDKIKEVISEHIKGVNIPKNLSIIATMNTSDESVYFMDSAFKRRWQFQYISADTYGFNGDLPVTSLDNFNDDNEVKQQANAKITCCNIDYLTWNDLRQSINKFMKLHKDRIRGIEDKQIGLWFIKAVVEDDNKTINQQDIQYKLMHYLWDNVFARDKKPLTHSDNNGLGLGENIATFGDFAQRWEDFIAKLNIKCPFNSNECVNKTDS